MAVFAIEITDKKVIATVVEATAVVFAAADRNFVRFVVAVVAVDVPAIVDTFTNVVVTVNKCSKILQGLLKIYLMKELTNKCVL